jgi:hypothetical protein
MKQVWLFRLCLGLMLFVAANRIFALTETSTKTKYTLQFQADDEEEDEDVILPSLLQDLDFKSHIKNHSASQPGISREQSATRIPLFIRFRNLRL